MSILIKGIDISSKEDLELFGEDSHIVIGGHLYPIELDQLVEIPTPHGRLIDADLFKELIKDSVPSWAIGVKIPTYGDMDIMDKIYIMPTILEEEK